MTQGNCGRAASRPFPTRLLRRNPAPPPRLAPRACRRPRCPRAAASAPSSARSAAGRAEKPAASASRCLRIQQQTRDTNSGAAPLEVPTHPFWSCSSPSPLERLCKALSDFITLNSDKRGYYDLFISNCTEARSMQAWHQSVVFSKEHSQFLGQQGVIMRHKNRLHGKDAKGFWTVPTRSIISQREAGVALINWMQSREKLSFTHRKEEILMKYLKL